MLVRYHRIDAQLAESLVAAMAALSLGMSTFVGLTTTATCSGVRSPATALMA
jgi:hypothetical protein